MAETHSTTVAEPAPQSPSHAPAAVQRQPELKAANPGTTQRVMNAIRSGSPSTPPGSFGKMIQSLPDAASQRSAFGQLQSSYGNSYVGQVIQRKCECGDKCEKCAGKDDAGEEEKKIQRKSEGSLVTLPVGVASAIRSSGGGSPLSSGTRSLMESRFGEDFGDVRTHTDSSAAEAAGALGAQAFTTGRDIYFGPGHSPSETPADQKLMAHELTHVVQQRNGAVAPGSAKPVLDTPGDVFEREADANAQAIGAGVPQQGMASASVPLFRRGDATGPQEIGLLRGDVEPLPQAMAGPLQRQKSDSSTEGLSSPISGPVSMAELPDETSLWTATFPVESLVRVPMLESTETLFAKMVAKPADAERLGQVIAAKEALDEYLADKLHLPVKIERREIHGSLWYAYSIYGEELVYSRTLDFPVESLDSVSFESLRVISQRTAARNFQVVKAALLEAAFPKIQAELDDPKSIAEDPEDYAYNEVQAQANLVKQLFDQLDLLMKELDPSNEWLRSKVGARHDEVRGIREQTIKAESVSFTYNYNKKEGLSKTGGEVYDEAIQEAEDQGGVLGFLNKWSGKGLKLIGDITTMGGLGLDAENAQAYRRGEISYSAFKKNRWLNLGRASLNALITALTAGEGSGLTLRLLGLKEGTLAAGVAAGAAEGGVGGFAQAFSSDVYAEIVAHVTDDPGVRAFHESTIGGPQAWLEATALGGALGGAIGGVSTFARRFMRDAPLDFATLREKPAASTEILAREETSINAHIIAADEVTGEVTLRIRDPITGELSLVDGNAYTGEATVTSMATGEVTGNVKGGVFEPGPTRAPLSPGEVVPPPEFGITPASEGKLISVVEDAGPGKVKPANPAEASVLEAGKGDAVPSLEQIDAELAIVESVEPRKIHWKEYVEEVELSNDHSWRRNTNGDWCRFSNGRICVPGSRRRVRRDMITSAEDIDQVIEPSRPVLGKPPRSVKTPNDQAAWELYSDYFSERVKSIRAEVEILGRTTKEAPRDWQSFRQIYTTNPNLLKALRGRLAQSETATIIDEITSGRVGQNVGISAVPVPGPGDVVYPDFLFKGERGYTSVSSKSRDFRNMSSAEIKKTVTADVDEALGNYYGLRFVRRRGLDVTGQLIEIDEVILNYDARLIPSADVQAEIFAYGKEHGGGGVDIGFFGFE